MTALRRLAFPFLLAALLFPAAQAGAQNKPKLAVLNIESAAAQPEETARVSENLPGAYLPSSNFQLAEVAILKQVAEEWAMPSLLSERERADKLGAKYGLDLLVVGKLQAFTRKGWLVSFVIMNSQSRFRTREQILGYRGEFYSYLSEADPALAEALAGLREWFHVPDLTAIKERKRKKPGEALPGVVVKKLLEGKTIQGTGLYFIQYRKDGKWAVSDAADGYFEERGEWWIDDYQFCVSVPKLDEPFCRYVKRTEDGGYRLVMDGGAEQELAIQ